MQATSPDLSPGIGKSTEVRCGVPDRPHAVAVQKRCLLSLSYRRIRGDHLSPGHPWPFGILSGVHLQTSNPSRATRPRIYLQLIKVLYSPAPARIHHPCSILE